MKQDNSLESQVNQSLDDSIENLSPDIRRRLNQSRIEACQRPKATLISWKKATALSLFLAVTMSWLFLPEKEDISEVVVAEVLHEDLDMLENLEFVYWMAEQNDTASM